MDLTNFGDSLEAIAPSNLPPELADHLPIAQANAMKNMQAVTARNGAELNALHAQAKQTQTPSVALASKIIRLRHLASEQSRILSQFTACRTQCNHCCHIDVSVPRSEAKLIAKAIGRKISEPEVPKNIRDNKARKDFFGVKCTFLVEGKCSIYAHRPLVCRKLVNMDSTDLLCRLVPGVDVPVPYYNALQIHGYFSYLTQDEQYADIREWFPAHMKKE